MAEGDNHGFVAEAALKTTVLSELRSENSVLAGSIAAVLDAAIEAVEPRSAVLRAFERRGDGVSCPRLPNFGHRLGCGRRVWILAVGKASEAMAGALYELFGKDVVGGLVATKHASRSHVGPLTVWTGEHPVPGPGSQNIAQATRDILAQVADDDLVLCAVSGGASALWTSPRLGPESWRRLHRAMLVSGLSILDFNGLRGALDAFKAGGISQMVGRAELLTCIISDVVGDEIALVGGGPTVAGDPRPEPGIAALEAAGEVGLVAEIRSALKLGCPDDAGLGPRHHLLVASNGLARESAVAAATARNFVVHDHGSRLEGPAERAARHNVVEALDAPAPCGGAATLQEGPRLDIWGGETTVEVRGEGLGGRNQHLAVAAMGVLKTRSRVIVATLASDGEDGPTDAAGALVSPSSAARAQTLGRNLAAVLANNDSYHLLDELGDLLRTGPTGTNVCDFLFVFSRL